MSDPVQFSNTNDLRRCAPEYTATSRPEPIISDLIVFPDSHSTQKIRLVDEDDRDVDDLLQEFSYLPAEVVTRVWAEQRGEYSACVSLLASLPEDYEDDPVWLQELRETQQRNQTEVRYEETETERDSERDSERERTERKRTYKDIVLVAAEETERQKRQDQVRQEELLRERRERERERIWKPRLLVIKGNKNTNTNNTTSAVSLADRQREEEEEEEERELEWRMCCEGERDAMKSSGRRTRLATASGVHVRFNERDQRMKRMATSMK